MTLIVGDSSSLSSFVSGSKVLLEFLSSWELLPPCVEAAGLRQRLTEPSPPLRPWAPAVTDSGRCCTGTSR